MTDQITTDRSAVPPAPDRAALVRLLTARRLAAAAPAGRTTAPAAPAGVPLLPRDADLPLSAGQYRLWLLEQLGAGGAAYLVPVGLRIPGALDVNALERALTAIHTRHEVLRTRYGTRGNDPVQTTDAPGHLPLRRARLADLTAGERRTELDRLIAEEGSTAFDLAADHPVRALLADLGGDGHLLLLTFHHIAFDGWSGDVLVRELTALYEAFSTGGADPLPPLTAQYADLAAWQAGRLEGAEGRQQLDYWRSQLSGLAPLALPVDRPHPPEWDADGAVVDLDLPAALGTALTALGREHGATPFMTVLAALHALLARVSGQDDTAVGTPVAGRTHPQSEALIGFFANTLVLRADTSDDPAFTTLLERVRESALNAYSHQDVPFDRLVTELRPGRDLSRNPLFQVSLTVDAAPAAGRGAAAFTPLHIGWAPAKFDLAIALQERPDGSFAGQLGYPTALFDRSSAERVAGQFVQLLHGALADPHRRIGELDLRDATERALPPAPAAVPAPAAPATVADRIAAHAAARPRAVAVTAPDAGLSYADLDAAANRLARELRSLGAGPGTLVGVSMPRSAALVTTLLGVMRSGAAYLPLDPDQPADRLAFMAEDAGLRILLTAGPGPQRVPECVTHTLAVDDPATAARIAARPATAPAGGAGPDDLAYVIYTSGSTGRPKGCMLDHRNVARLLTVTEDRFGFGPDDVWSLFHSYAFDFSVWEIWGALAHGGRLVVVPFAVSRSPQETLELLARERVTVLNQTPSAFSGLASAALADRATAGRLALRTVVFGGEALDPRALLPWFTAFGDATPEMVNMYGITETTVHVTHRRVTAGDAGRAGDRSPIGVPVGDLTLHLLDGAMNPVPAGVPGELYVGGAGVARGYLGRPDLTAQRFVPDPFATAPGARMYRSGDRARRTPDGELQFLGRLDDQVKIRGFRIETGEIESALLAHPAVAAAVVAAVPSASGDARLVGYVVPAPGAALDVAGLRAALARRLPAYMVPAAFVPLDAIPLTVNGKADRRALPAPDSARLATGRDHVPPRTAAETAVAAVWADVLELPEVGALDGFFDLGGDSIRAVRVVGRLRDLGYDVTVQDLFRRQTVETLAAPFTDGATTVRPRTAREPFALLAAQDRQDLPDGVEDAYPMSEAQAGMVFELLADTERSLYHNVTGYAVRDEGPFDAPALRAAVDAVTARHEVLRTSFDLGRSEPVQCVHAPGTVTVPISHQDVRHLGEPAREAALARAIADERAEPLDLSGGPLWRLRAVLETDRRWRLLFVENHAILDGWSHNSLLIELLGHYRAFRSGTAPAAEPAPAVRFADFVALERETVADRRHKDFWAERVGEREAFALPGPWAAADGDPGDGYELRVDFTDSLPALQELGRSAGGSLKSVLLAAHVTVLGLLTDQRRFLSGLVCNGRLEETDGDRALGMHLNVVPFTAPEPTGTWRELVAAVFAEEVALLPHRRYPMGALRRESGIRLPALEVMFNYLNFHVLDEDLVDSDASVDDSPNEFPLAVSTEWGRIVLTIDGRTVRRERGELVARLYTRVLAAMAADPQALVSSLDLPAGERARVLTAPPLMGGTPQPYRSLPGVIGDMIAAHPGRVAVEYGDQRLTYRELGLRAAEMTVRLNALGIRRGDRVATLLPRGIEQVTAILAITRVGAAVVPLDPAHPVERLRYVLEDSAAVAAVAAPQDAARAGMPADRVVATHGTAGPDGATDLSGELLPDELAYVIYTSGSTGRPKGVMSEHRGVANLVDSHADLLGVRPGDRFLQFCAPVFDVSLLETLTALGTGATLVTAPAADLMPGAPLQTLLETARVDHLVTIPSALALLEPRPGGPRTVSVIGEECPRTLSDRWGAVCAFHNLYGPTEYTVVTSGERVTGRPTIGLPVPATRALVLDAALRPVAAGVTGELCVGGEGVARGYLGRPDLTAERFVPDPYGPPGSRMYRTGDRVRVLPDGRLDYQGRQDFQVKIRGFRIELGEIEAVLQQHPGLRHAVAVVRHDTGDPRIVAYLTPAGDTAPGQDELITFLQRHVPGYMVPAHFVVMDELPRTGSGKVDRKALPAPDARSGRTGRAPVPPRTPLERAVAQVWAQVLGLPEVGVEDDFFLIGGHSLLAMRAAARLAEVTGGTVGVREMTRHRTVAALAAAVGAGNTGANAADGPQAPVPLGDGPGRTVFAVHPGGGSVHWYRHLAGQLGLPFAAFEHPALTDPARAAATVDELAGRYLDGIRAAQPAGPYRVFGWCAGGPIAWEIARRIADAGDQVHLVLLDPVADSRDDDPPLDDLTAFDAAESVLARLRETTDPAEAAELRRRAVPLLLDIIDDGGLVVTEETVGDGYLERVRIWRDLRAATLGHRYRKAGLTLDLIAGDELAQAEHTAIGTLGFPLYLRRWEALAAGGLHVHRVPGSHLGVLGPRLVHHLAGAVAALWPTEKEN